VVSFKVFLVWFGEDRRRRGDGRRARRAKSWTLTSLTLSCHPPRRYFNRDVACIRTFFRRRFRYESKVFPRFSKSLSDDSVEGFRLDVEVEASGFGKAEAKALEDYMNGLKASGEMDEEEEESSDEDESGEEEEEEEEGVETRAEEVERLAKEAAEEKEAESASAPALVPRTEEEVVPAQTTNNITSAISNISSTITESLSSLTTTLTDSLSSLTVSTPSQPTTIAEPTHDLPPTSPTGSNSSLPPSSPPAPLRPLPAFHLPPSSPTHSISPSLFSTATTSRSKRPTQPEDVRTTITSDLAKERARTEGKHHARAGVSKAGKAKGSESLFSSSSSWFCFPLSGETRLVRSLEPTLVGTLYRSNTSLTPRPTFFFVVPCSQEEERGFREADEG